MLDRVKRGLDRIDSVRPATKAAVERRKASAPEADGSRERIVRGARRARSTFNVSTCGAAVDYAPFGAPPPSFCGGPFVHIVGMTRVQIKNAPREYDRVP